MIYDGFWGFLGAIDLGSNKPSQSEQGVIDQLHDYIDNNKLICYELSAILGPTL